MPRSVLHLQRTAGNQAVQQLLAQRATAAQEDPVATEGDAGDFGLATLPDTPTPPPPSRAIPAPPEHLGRVQRQGDNSADGGGLLAGLRAKLDGVVSGLRSGWSSLSQDAQSAFGGLEARAAGVKDTLGGLAEGALAGIQSGWSTLQQTASAVTRGVEDRMQAGAKSVADAASGIYQAIKRVDGGALQGAWTRLLGTIGGLKATVESLGKAALGRLSALWDGLKDRFSGALSGLGARADAMLGEIGAAADGIRERLSSAWSGMQQRASQMSGIAGQAARFLASLLERFLNSAKQAWAGIQSLWSGLKERFSALWQRVQSMAKSAWEGIKQRAETMWKSIDSTWSQLRERASAQVGRLLGTIGQVVQRLTGVSVSPLVDQLTRLAPLAKGIQQVMADPEGALQPMVAAIAQKIETEFPGKAPQVVAERVAAAGGGAAAAAPAARSGPPVQRAALGTIHRSVHPGETVQRAPTTPAASTAPARTSETFADVGEGLLFAVQHQFESVGVLGLVKSAVDAVIHPFDAIAREWGEMDRELSASYDRIFAQFSFSSLQNAWASVLRMLDLGLIVWRHLNNIVLVLYPWFALAMIVGGAAVGAAAGGVFGGAVAGFFTAGAGAPVGAFFGGAVTAGAGAAAGAGIAYVVGEPLLASFLIAEGATVVRALAELLTVPQNNQEKDVDYGQAGASTLSLIVAGILWLASAIASVVGKYLGIGARLAKIPSVARFLEDFRAARAKLKGGGPPEAKPVESDPNAAKPRPNEVVICRMCVKLTSVPADLLAERNALSQAGQNLFDQKLGKLIRDPNNPTPLEFDRMRGIVKSLKNRFPNLEAGLQDEANKANPAAKPPFGPSISELPRLRAAAQQLLADIQEFAKARPDRARDIARSAKRLEADMNGVLSDMEQGRTEATPKRIEGLESNLKGIKNELSANKAAPPGTQFGVPKKINGKTIEIDRVSADGSHWVNDKNMNLFGADDPRVADLTAQAKQTIECAQLPENAVGGKAPSVEFNFGEGVTPEAAAKLRAVQVNGQRLIVTGAEKPLGGR